MKQLRTLIVTSLKKIVLPTMVLVIVCCAASLQVRADTLNITGSFDISHLNIDFLPLGGGTGTFTVAAGATGIFVPLAGMTGTAMDLSTGASPVGAPFLLQSFLTFGANQNLRFDLTFLNLGGLAPCGPPLALGQSCTAPPPLNEFNLTSLPGGSTPLTFSLQGNVVNTATNQVTPFTGTFSMQVVLTIPEFLQVIQTGGSVTASYSAILTTSVSEPAPVPEPASMLLLGSGLTGVFVSRRVRRRFTNNAAI